MVGAMRCSAKVIEGTAVVDEIEKVRTGNAGFHRDVPVDAVVIERGGRTALIPVLRAEAHWQQIGLLSDLHLRRRRAPWRGWAVIWRKHRLRR